MTFHYDGIPCINEKFLHILNAHRIRGGENPPAPDFYLDWNIQPWIAELWIEELNLGEENWGLIRQDA
jgi:hypothetical protein